MNRRIGRSVVAASLVATTIPWAAGGGSAAAGPPPAPSVIPVLEEITVDATDQDGLWSDTVLVQGESYTLESRGTYVYVSERPAGAPAIGGARSDAECTDLPPDPSWQPHRFAAYNPAEDWSDLYVNGSQVTWTPAVPDALGCDASGTHTYTHTFTAPTTGRLHLGIYEEGPWNYHDNQGELTVLLRPTESLFGEYDIDSTDPDGVVINGLADDRTYAIEVVGTYTTAGVLADAECVTLRSSPATPVGLTPNLSRPQSADPYDVNVDGRAVDWTPQTPSAFGCDDIDHAYRYELAPRTAAGPPAPATALAGRAARTPGTLRLDIDDDNHADNQGTLAVRIFEVTRPQVAPSADPADDPELVEEVVVDSRSSQGATSLAVLPGDRSYLLEVRGTYRWGGGQADAECSTELSDPVWRRGRSEVHGEGAFDLMIDGTVVEWTALSPDARGCSTSHVYRRIHHRVHTSQAHFVIADTNYNDNQGSLTVAVYLLGEAEPTSEVLQVTTLDSRHRPGVDTIPLSPLEEYQIEVAGTFTSAPSLPNTHDAECTSIGGAPGVPDAYSSTTSDPSDDVFDVYVDGRPITWTPTKGTPIGCNDADHTYVHTFRPDRFGPVNLRVEDPHPQDNEGVLDVTVRRLTSPDARVGAPAVRLAEEVLVPSNSSSGANSMLPLQEGSTYLLEVSGTYFWGEGFADGECSSTLIEGLWHRNRFEAQFPSTDLFDVLVDGAVVEWQPTTADIEGCNTTDNIYRTLFVPADSGPVNFRINDPGTGDNSGVLKVKILHVDEIPLGAYPVVASDPGGVNTIPLVEDTTYRFVARGEYNPAAPLDWAADAECSRPPNGTWTASNNLAPNLPDDDVLDVYVDRGPISWTPASGVGECDPGHVYESRFDAARTGTVNLAVFDTLPQDNQGHLIVEVYQSAG